MADPNLNDLLTSLALELPKALLKRILDGSATAADLSVARQLLRDNDFQSMPGANEGLDSLGAKLGDVELEPYKFHGGASG